MIKLFKGLPPQLQVGTQGLGVLQAPFNNHNTHHHHQDHRCCDRQLQAPSDPGRIPSALWHGRMRRGVSSVESASRAACVRLQRVLTKQELAYLERAQHRPTAVTQVPQSAAGSGDVP